MSKNTEIMVMCGIVFFATIFVGLMTNIFMEFLVGLIIGTVAILKGTRDEQ